MRKRSKVFNFWTLMILIVIVFYGLFFLYPIGTLLREAVIQPVTGALTFEHFEKFFERRYYFQTIINTFKVTSIATVLTLAIGVPLAYFTNRSEEHTSELQSRPHLVCRLLLEKKKKKKITQKNKKNITKYTIT